MSKTETATKTRRARARQTQVVIGAIEENASMLAVPNLPTPEFAQDRAARIIELIDELKRSLGKDTDSE